MEAKEMSYKQTKIEIGRLILKCLKAAEVQERKIDLKKLQAQIELDYGVGQLAVKRIIDNLETLGLVKLDSNNIKKVLERQAFLKEKAKRNGKQTTL